MAQMAFQIQAVGAVGGAADLIIGVKSSNIIRIFAMSVLGSASGLNHITTSDPFFVHDDPVLDNLMNETVDFEVSGMQAMWGDLSFSFKIYNGDGIAVYEESKLVATRGTSMGGFSRSAMTLNYLHPKSEAAMVYTDLLGFELYVTDLVRDGVRKGRMKR